MAVSRPNQEHKTVSETLSPALVRVFYIAFISLPPIAIAKYDSE